MALSRHAREKNSLFSHLRPYLTFERLIHTQIYLQYCDVPQPSRQTNNAGRSTRPRCVKLNALSLGVRKSMISRESYNVVRGLQMEGFKTYLVGGCVRDLLINRVPKDFDVITTAKLDQVKKMFARKRAIIVGRRFPVCRVGFGDSVVEVTTFGTKDKQSESKKKPVPPIPAACDPHDFALWSDCMRRDFTINSMFYDPFTNTIFDYADAMKDLRSFKLRTLAPASQSFKEDQARIMRGIRIAARLRLSVSEETEAAIRELSSSVAEISKPRLMMEVNYMLSYGAAKNSMLLLKKFKLLEMLLPFQAAYLSEQLDGQVDPHSSMLTKLFHQLDQLVICDQPCHASLWASLLSLHMALFSHPQRAEVLLTFASLLHHGNWEKSIQFAREHASGSRIFAPEISTASVTLSDDEISQKVTLLCDQAKKSIYILTKLSSLKEAMTRFPDCPSPDMIFISHNMGKHVWEVFEGLQKDVTTGVKGEKGLVRIDYMKLGAGDIAEVRFVLGQIIIDALASSDSAKSELTKHKLMTMKLENEDKQSRSPFNNELLAKEAGKASMLRGDDQKKLHPFRSREDGVKTSAVPSGKRVSRRPGQNPAPGNLGKVEHVKSGIQGTSPALSDLVSSTLKRDEHVDAATQETGGSLSNLFK